MGQAAGTAEDSFHSAGGAAAAVGSPCARERFVGDDSTRIEKKARELHTRLLALEQGISSPTNVSVVGFAYKELVAWQRAHEWDPDLQHVIERIGGNGPGGALAGTPVQYPTWRRQALEEAYRLMYDEVARRGFSAIEDLPEPPTSEEIGFRRLNENLLTGKAGALASMPGKYEDRSCNSIGGKWEYEIRKVPPLKEGGVCGRQIIAGRAHQDGVMSKLFGPVEGCCARRSEEAKKARGPFWLPEGSKAMPKRPPAAPGPPA